MTTVNLYQSDVRGISTEELKVLEDELQEAYESSSGEGVDAYWTDRCAEDRYYEIERELRRRWEEENPEEAAAQRKDIREITGTALNVLSANLSLTRVGFFGHESSFLPKIGSTINVRRPERFCR